MGRGGYKTGGGGGVSEVLPLQKGGLKKVLAILKGGHKKFWGSFNMGAWSFSHSDGGGGAEKVLPCLDGGWGGVCKKFRTRNFPIL